jgi:hypothetical protein
VYAAWSDARFSGRQIIQIAFTMSTDGGQTWAKPLLRVNLTPQDIPLQDQQAFTPAVHVAADGTVGVSYTDFRSNTPAPGALTDQWLVTCHADCMSAGSWSETHLDGPFDIEQAPVAGGLFLGDYTGLTSIGTSFGAFFTEGVNRSLGDPSDVFWTLAPG